MKKILSCFLFLFLLSSCTGGEEDSRPVIQSKHLVTKGGACPDDMVSVYTTDSQWPIDCIYPSQFTPQVVSAEVDYAPQKNLINLSPEASQKIVERLIKKGNEEVKKYENTGSLIEGEWKAVYNPPKYPDEYDSIVVTLSGKTYTFPGVYGLEEKKRYLKNIEEAKGRPENSCNDSQKYPDSVIIDKKYYRPPTSGDCMSGVRTFQYFDSFSPSGYYLIYRVSGWEWSEVRMIDLETGNNLFDKTYDSQSLITWTPDNKQMLYYSEGWDNVPAGIYLTRVGNFPNADKILEPRQGLVSIDIDDIYIYTLELHKDYYLRVLSRTNYEEVYTRIVKKE